jgi:tetratricopeptide (TPR) repeat protein
VSCIDVKRVVYLYSDSADQSGSGYLIARDLVLTAAHCVGPVGTAVEVKALRREPGSASLTLTPKAEFQVEAVSGSHLERSANSEGFALLSPRGNDPFELGDIPAVPLGRLAGDDELPAETLGFPQLADTRGRINVEHAFGILIPLTGAREIPSTVGPAWSLTFQVQSGTPLGSGALWRGASGAALFGKEHLLGVLSEYQPTVEGRLRAIPTELLGNDPSLTKCFKEHTGRDVSFDLIWAGQEILEPPYTPLPESWSAADLLTARHAVVPFSGRAEYLRRLEEWCRDDDRPEVWLLKGKGAVGKTRLALELCHRVMVRDGWIAGLLSVQTLDTSTLMRLEKNRLIVVDDADSRVGQLDTLLKARASHRLGRRLRVLAVARQSGNWWEAVRRRYDELVEPEPLGVDSTPPEERAKVYQVAWESFWKLERLRKTKRQELDQQKSSDEVADSAEMLSAVAEGAVPDLYAENFASYLFILIFALIDVRRLIDHEGRQELGVASPVTRGSELYDQVLDLEREDWIRSAEKAGLPADPVLLDRIVAVTSLAYASGSTAGHAETEAAQRLRIVPDLVDANEQTRRQFVRLFQERIEGSGALRQLHPRRLGEHLIEKMIRSFPEVVEQLLTSLPDSADSERKADAAQQAINTLELLNVLAFGEETPNDSRGQVRDEVLYQTLSEALRQHGPDLIVLVRELVDADGLLENEVWKSLASTLQAIFSRLPDDHNDVAAKAADKLEEFCPDGLLQLAKLLQTRATDYYESWQHNTETRVKLGEACKRLSHLLADSGERRTAHDYALQAVGHFNALIREDESDESLLRKANALANLAVRDYEIGRFDESLEPAREAVDLYETLLRHSHDRMHHVYLSFALCNLSNTLAHLGRWRDALHTAHEAYELVGEDLPHEPNGQALKESKVKEALAFAARTLARRLPDAEEPVGAIGEWREHAIKSAKEACRLYEELKQEKRGRFDRDYALSLVILGRRYADVQSWDDSIGMLEEARDSYEELAKEHQEAIRTRHAEALSYLAASYLRRGCMLGRAEDLATGLGYIDEALRHYDNMSSEDKFTSRTNHAIAKRIKAEFELQLNEIEDARQHAREAVTELEHVADHTWKGRRHLGRAHVILGDASARCGDSEAAMHEYQRAKEIFEDLNAEEPDQAGKELDNVQEKLEKGPDKPES